MRESNETGQHGAFGQQPRSLQELQDDLAQAKNVLDHAIRSVIEKRPEHTLLAHQAEWHIKGLIYHYERLHALCKIVADEVGGRALALNADIIVMHSPEMQDLIFEFYALVNLARITLDEVIKYVQPLFVRGTHLPKSINDFLKGQSDCPLRSRLSQQPVLGYLVDIRNCIVHYRTFATSDNTVAVADDFDEDELQDMPFEHFRSVTRVYFRRLGGVRVSVNVLVPDAIYVYDTSGARKRIAYPFSYSNRYSLLSQSREFIRLCAAAVSMALDLLANNDAVYIWEKC